MRLITLMAILFGTVLAKVEGFGLEELQKAIDLVQQIIGIAEELQLKYIGPESRIESDSVTAGESTCPEEAANGVYPLKPAHSTFPPFLVYCEKGGWIVIHRRFNGKLNFDRTWNEYREGFGDIQGEFWLGLEKMHQLTRTGSFELLVVLKDFDGVEKWSKFDGFQVAGEFEHYRLDLKKFVAGTAGDSIFWHNGMKFSTSERDNDTGNKHCAQLFRSGWWFKQCFDTNLNGLYGQGESYSRMSWYTFDRKHKGLKEARMMARRVQACGQDMEFASALLVG